MERFKFKRRIQQERETVSIFLAETRKLSEYGNFKDGLEEALRDKFVVASKMTRFREGLYKKETYLWIKQLTVEQATKDVISIHKGSNEEEQEISFISKRKLHKSVAYPPCHSCGKTNHKRSECYFKDTICRRCSKKGHIKAICKSKQASTINKGGKIHHIKWNDESDEDFDTIFEIYNVHNIEQTKKIWVYPTINNT